MRRRLRSPGKCKTRVLTNSVAHPTEILRLGGRARLGPKPQPESFHKPSRHLEKKIHCSTGVRRVSHPRPQALRPSDRDHILRNTGASAVPRKTRVSHLE